MPSDDPAIAYWEGYLFAVESYLHASWLDSFQRAHMERDATLAARTIDDLKMAERVASPSKDYVDSTAQEL